MRRLFLGLAMVVAACSSGPAATTLEVSTEGSTTSSAAVTVPEETFSSVTDATECAHVIEASVSSAPDGTFTVSATVRSADTGWDKYSDRWTVGSNSEVFGERILTHPHETEQPFTRSLSYVEIPDGIAEVEIAAHDSVAGFCGDTLTVPVLR